MFPDAQPLEVFLDRKSRRLGRHGFTPANTLAVTAACRDEIASGLRAGVRRRWHGAFDFSTLSAIPLAGATGVGAVIDHVPDTAGRGHIVVFAMPHIGVLADGTPGRVMRRGRLNPSTACGSLVAATAWAATRDGPRGGAPGSGGAGAEFGADDNAIVVDPADPEQSLVRARLLAAVPDLGDLDPVRVVLAATAVAFDDVWRLFADDDRLRGIDLAVVAGVLVHADNGDFAFPTDARVRVGGLIGELESDAPAGARR